MKTSARRPFSPLLALGLAAGLLASSLPVMAAAANPAPAETTAVPSNIRPHVLAATEKITISIENEPLCQRTVTIDDKGQVDLYLVGKTTVVGLTTDQAAKVIEKAYIDGLYLRRPKATVSIEEQVIRTVTVLGAVKNAGRIVIPSDRDVNILDVILLAGGFTEIANGKNVLVARILPDGTRKSFEDINVEAFSKGQKDLKDALIILPDDIINVKTRIF